MSVTEVLNVAAAGGAFKIVVVAIKRNNFAVECLMTRHCLLE